MMRTSYLLWFQAKNNVNTAFAISFVAFAVVFIAGLVIVSTIQATQAQGPPPKAQLILSTEPPKERGAVASGGTGGGGRGEPCPTRDS
jgi:hypothetical protein